MLSLAQQQKNEGEPKHNNFYQTMEASGSGAKSKAEQRSALSGHQKMRQKSIFVNKTDSFKKDVDEQSVKSMQRILKFAGNNMSAFLFPKRERFNEKAG